MLKFLLNNNWFKPVVAGMLAIILTTAAAQEIQVAVVPDSVLVGDPVQLQITVNSRALPELVEKPQLENIAWMNGISKQTRVVNTSIEQTAIYGFRILKEGEYEIPPLKVKVGSKIFETQPLTVKAFPAGNRKVMVKESGNSGKVSEQQVDDMIYGKGVFLADGTDFYVGEEIPVEIAVYIQGSLNCEFTSWPEFNLDNVIFRDYGKSNKQNNRFEVPDRATNELINGLNYQVIKLRTAFRAIAPGVLQPQAKIGCELKIPDKTGAKRRGGSMFDDDFFDSIMSGRSYRSVPHTVQVAFPPLNIKALPPVPDGVDWLGLVGNWRVDYQLDNKKFKVGDAFTLKVQIAGTGAIETLQPPKLECPGFRIYPPEINRLPASGGNNQNTELNYVMIPLKPGEVELRMNTAIFSCPMDKYNNFVFSKKIQVSPNAEIPGEKVSATTIDEPVEVAKSTTPNLPRSQILYLKKDAGCALLVPLYRNYLYLYIILFLAGPLVLMAREWNCRRQKSLANDPSLHRRRNALAMRGKIVKKLKNSKIDNVSDTIQNNVVPWLNDLLEQPPGTTATALAEKVNDQELKDCLNSCGAANYLPGAANIDGQELKKRIISACKKIVPMLILALMLPLSVNAQKTPEPVKIKKSACNINEALTAYDSGEFKKAGGFFKERINQHCTDSASLYNLGNCYCQQQNYPAALLCLERARLLAPNDSDIIENLNFVRKKLFLQPVGEVNDPSGLLRVMRDTIRPDQWGLIIAAAWFCLCVIIAYRRSLTSNKLIVLLGICTIAAAVAATAIISQYRGDYAENLAVVMNNVKLRSLPSEITGQEESIVKAGSKVNIIEPRAEWSRVRYGDSDGWVRSNSMIPITPGSPVP